MAKLKVMLHPKVDARGVKKFRLALRVTSDGKRSYSYLGYDIDPSDWDNAADKVKRSNAKHVQLNRLIRKKYDELDDVIYELKSKNIKLTPRQIIDSIKENNNKKTFFDLAHNHVADLRKIGKHNRAISENSMINRIKEFVGSEDLYFEDITEAMLKKLKIYLKTNREISERSVMNIYVFIRLMFNNALKEDLIDSKNYPFGPGKLKIKYPDSKKIGLSKSEIIAIEELKLEKGSAIWDTKNIFLFSFYLAGIRISDALKMKWSNVVDDRLYYKMGKNDKGDSLKLPEKAMLILEDYRKDKNKNNGLLFPFFKDVDQKNSKLMYSRVKTTTKKINRYLEQIANKAGIDKKVTTHIARHSFGNIAGSDIPVQMLQKLYRHSDLSTTIGYQSNFDHTKTDEALNDVLNF